MNQQKSLLRISELLSRFKFQTIIQNANAQLDVNIVAEDILIPILNIAYGCRLKNAKYSERDTSFPALDLLDRDNRIAFQITSTSSIKKIRKTIEGIIKNNFHTEFDNFYIYIITQKQNSYDKTVLETITQGLFTFTEKNILDEKDLYQKVASLPFEKILKIEELLEKQFSDLAKSETEIKNQFEEIIKKINLTHNEQYLITELKGLYQVRKGWLDKKLFFENRLPMTSDINQQFSINVQIEEINEKINGYSVKISKLLTQISE